MTGDALQQQLQFIDAERFSYLVVGAILHGLDGGLDGSITGDHDDQRIRTTLSNTAECIDASGTRKPQIEQHSVERLEIEKAMRLFGGIGDVGRKTKRIRNFTAGLTHRSFVVDDQEIQEVGWFHLGCGDRANSC
jgi:hypothetical protein